MIRRWWQKHGRKFWAAACDYFTEPFFLFFFIYLYFFLFPRDFFSSAGTILWNSYKEKSWPRSPCFHYSFPSLEDLLVNYTSRAEKRFKLRGRSYTEQGTGASRTEVGGFWCWGCFHTAMLPALPSEWLQSGTVQLQPEQLWPRAAQQLIMASPLCKVIKYELYSQQLHRST